MKISAKFSSENRIGGAAVMILFLTTLLFVAVVFSIDIARIQLAQVELQAGADLAARAGAEAMSRGVGGSANSDADLAIRNEIISIAAMNKVGGKPLQLESTAIHFGSAVLNENSGGFEFSSSLGGNFDDDTNSVNVVPDLPSFPVVFGGFVGKDAVGLAKSSRAMIAERDIVIVLDRSTSMLARDAGVIDVADYDPGLQQLEDELYDVGDAFYPDTEFVIVPDGTGYELTRMQALKLAVMRFREEIDSSRGHEQLGLTSYNSDADTPPNGYKFAAISNPIAASVATPSLRPETLPANKRAELVGTGITIGSERYASALEAKNTGYVNFDFNYLGMRRKGSTNIVAGIEQGVDILFGPERRSYAIPILILMTDGAHNQAGDPVVTANLMKANHPELLIYTVTFGAGADQLPMQQVAAEGGGNHNHANNVNDLIVVFRDLATSAGVTLIK